MVNPMSPSISPGSVRNALSMPYTMSYPWVAPAVTADVGAKMSNKATYTKRQFFGPLNTKQLFTL